MKATFTLIIIVFLMSVCVGQNPVLVASVDASEVVEGGYVELSFTLTNVEGGNFEAPSINGFNLISGPNRSSQIFISNGNRTQKMSWSFTLLATKLGRHKIGSASIQVGKKRVFSKPIEIKVVKGREINQSMGPDGLPTEEMIYVESVEVAAIKDPMPSDGPCVFTGKTAIYYGND